VGSITPHGYIFIKPAGVKVFVPEPNQQAKTLNESVRNARCLHRCTGDAHTRGPGKEHKKRWRLPARKRSGKKTGWNGEGLLVGNATVEKLAVEWPDRARQFL